MSSSHVRHDARDEGRRTGALSVRHLHAQRAADAEHVSSSGTDGSLPDPHTRSSAAYVVHTAVQRLLAGEMVVVIDDPNRENEGDLIMAAQFMTSSAMAFMVRHTTGIICTPMTDERADELGLPLMVADNTDPHGTAFTVSVDAVGTGTGVSAGNRAATVAALAAGTTTAGDLRTPGHIFPLRARRGGVLERGGHTEAAVDLLRIAGLQEVGVISELVADDGDMLRGHDLLGFAAEHDLAVVSIAELVEYRLTDTDGLRFCGAAELPTSYGMFEARAYHDVATDQEHLVLTAGNIDELGQSPQGALVRLHSECMTGDLMSSLRCDCGDQLRESLQLISRRGGILIYLRGHEGRGIGLGDKLRAYTLQQAGRDTVEANLELGLPVDGREYSAAAGILKQLGVRRIQLISNNPAKQQELTRLGIEVMCCVHLPSRATPHNLNYLRTKKNRLGHAIDL